MAADIRHRVETLEHFIRRIQRGDTPRRLTWPAFVVDSDGRLVTRERREAILRELGIDLELEREPDVYDFADQVL